MQLASWNSPMALYRLAFAIENLITQPPPQAE
jgi:hypothetical protein